MPIDPIESSAHGPDDGHNSHNDGPDDGHFDGPDDGHFDGHNSHNDGPDHADDVVTAGSGVGHGSGSGSGRGSGGGARGSGGSSHVTPNATDGANDAAVTLPVINLLPLLERVIRRPSPRDTHIDCFDSKDSKDGTLPLKGQDSKDSVDADDGIVAPTGWFTLL